MELCSLPVISLGPNYGGGNEDNGNLLQKVPCTHRYTECPRPCGRPLLTRTSTGDAQTWSVSVPVGSLKNHSIMLEELWTEAHDIVQETRIMTIPKKKKCKKGKWLSEEGLQIAVERREAKCKGEKERYTHLNAEFQRIARRDKKAFLSD